MSAECIVQTFQVFKKIKTKPFNEVKKKFKQKKQNRKSSGRACGGA